MFNQILTIMMSTFIAMLIMVLVSFLIARRMKDHRTFVNLMVFLCLGVIVGAFVKSHSIDNDTNVKTVVIETDSCPTLPSLSPAVVWTDDLNTDSVMGKDTTMNRDTVSITQRPRKVPTKAQQSPERIDDS